MRGFTSGFIPACRAWGLVVWECGEVSRESVDAVERHYIGVDPPLGGVGDLFLLAAIAINLTWFSKLFLGGHNLSHVFFDSIG